MAKKKKNSRYHTNMDGRKRRKVVDKVRRLIGKSYTDEEILDACKIKSDFLRTVKSEILNMDTAIYEHLSSGAVYSDYLMKAQQMVKKLHKLQSLFKSRGQYNAYVAAIKQEKDIYDSCIKHGQDFGYIEKKVQSLEVSGEFTFGHLTEEEIKKEIATEIKELNKLANSNTIEMRPELLDVTDEDVKSYVPTNIVTIPEKSSVKKVKIKNKVGLRKSV